MRELKFRAYDSITGKVSEPFDVKESWGDYLIDFEDYSTDGALDSIIWEQYTGLKDKNGKEIYEGDIVDDGKHICEIRWSEHLAAFEALNENEGYRSSVWFEAKYGEVIGNIHENPELLGEE